MISTFTKAFKQLSSLRSRAVSRHTAPLEEFTEHDREMVQFYSHFVRPGGLCFDVGANIGNRVKIFLNLGARVVAIEPQDACINILKQQFGKNQNCELIQTALGASEGKAEMLISDANTISSLSPEWIKSVKASGRFSEYTWDKKQTISITTLDTLIGKYGQPSFIKIDVEGFEFEVVSGLSKPVKFLSFEFTPEFLESTRSVISHLQHLGDARFNYCLGESMELKLPEWVDAATIKKILSGFEGDTTVFGDVYVRFPV